MIKEGKETSLDSAPMASRLKRAGRQMDQEVAGGEVGEFSWVQSCL